MAWLTPAAAEPERLPARMPWGPAYYRKETAARRTQHHACARCRTVAELVWSAGELVYIGCLPTPTVANRGVWSRRLLDSHT